MSKNPAKRKSQSIPPKVTKPSIPKPSASKVTKPNVSEVARPNTLKTANALKQPKKGSTTAASEIDELFAKKTPVVIPEKKPASNPVNLEKDDMADIRGARNNTRRLTDDGLAIYTAEEMRIGKGNDTSDCPFDCTCCY